MNISGKLRKCVREIRALEFRGDLFIRLSSQLKTNIFHFHVEIFSYKEVIILLFSIKNEIFLTNFYQGGDILGKTNFLIISFSYYRVTTHPGKPGKSGEKILALESQGIFRLALDFVFFQAFFLCRERAAAEGKTCLTTDAKVEA